MNLPLDYNEIKTRAEKFKSEWKDAKSEMGERQAFWIDFFNIFNIPVRRVSTWFETRVKITKTISGSIDLFYPGKLLIEHKTRGKDLKKAFDQAIDYLPGVDDSSLPRYILVCDFYNFRLYDMENKGYVESFTLDQLPEKISLFDFISGHEAESVITKEDPVNRKAAAKMGALHQQLFDNGYRGHDLEVMLVRLLFCLFAEDTNIFKPRQFHEFIAKRTAQDGSDLGSKLVELFQHLDTEPKFVQAHTDATIKEFPYVNGKLFQEPIRIGAFNSEMRKTLLEVSELDWSLISPEIFGALFQSVMDDVERREEGAHYTSEKNILKLIDPLFMNELWQEFDKNCSNITRLQRFHEKIGNLKFLDPACGCGNFLIVTYRELRKLELAVIRILRKNDKQLYLNAADLVKIKASNLAGIEINEFPARIAEVAMWLVDHQMNQLMENEFAQSIPDIPLKASARISAGVNALRCDWVTIFGSVPDYIIGNPPFIGKKEQTPEQKKDMSEIFSDTKGFGSLDYVSAWYKKATKCIQGTIAKVGFVSTNSITQGEQVGILWSSLINEGVEIGFAHRTFQWSNEAKNNASVHCVIIGFSVSKWDEKIIFTYENLKSEPVPVKASNINPYLVDAKNILLPKRTSSICSATPINKGSEATDFGHLIISEEIRNEILSKHPQAEKWIKLYLGSDEFINNVKRYCLWLVGISPNELKSIPEFVTRVESVRNARLERSKERTIAWAAYPTLFSENRQPTSNYLAIPKVSSGARDYIPIGFLNPDIIASGSLQVVPNASLYDFGILASRMHNSWMRYTCGRTKSDYQYSNTIVYNNFPWPVDANDKSKENVAEAASHLIACREKYTDSTLAELYDRVTMPPDLAKAHRVLDAAVDSCYPKKKFNSELERVSYLFDLYEQLATPLAMSGATKKPKEKAPKKTKAV